MGILKGKQCLPGYQLVEHVQVQSRRGPRDKERTVWPEDRSRSTSPTKKRAMPHDDYDYLDHPPDAGEDDGHLNKKLKSSGKVSDLCMASFSLK